MNRFTIVLTWILTILIKCDSRDIITTLTAPNWPTTQWSPICEAHMYWQVVASSYQNSARDDLVQEFVEKIIQIDIDIDDFRSYEDMVRLVMDVSKGLSGVSDFEIQSLEYSLALREFSPVCELHRKLGQEEVLNNPSTLEFNKAFVKVSSSCLNITLNANQLLQGFDINNALDVDCKAVVADPLIESEVLWRVTREEKSTEIISTSRAVMLLYGNIGREDFRQMYELVQSHVIGPIDLVVRHMVRRTFATYFTPIKCCLPFQFYSGNNE